MIKRILVIRPGALGDTVVTEPAVASLRAAFPPARIELAGRIDFLPLLVGEGLADACVSADSAAFTSLFTGGPVELPHYDLILAYLPDREGELAARLRDCAGRVAVFDPRPPERVPVHIVDHLLRALDALGVPVHIVDHLLCALDALGVPVLRREPRLECPPAWREVARALIGVPPGEYVVIHPGSGGRRKLWAAENWARAIEALLASPCSRDVGLREKQLRVVLTTGPADGGVIEDVVKYLASAAVVTVVRDQPITTVAGVLAGARAYAGCDSGVSHLAAAVGAPSVVLFGPTDPRVWAPRGGRVRIVCAPGGDLRALSPSDVVSAVRRLADTAC